MSQTYEPTPACIICHTGHAWEPCRACVERVETMLGELIELHRQAGDDPGFLIPPQGGDGSGSGSAERSIGINVAALDLDLGHDLIAALEPWEVDWRHLLDLSPYGAASELRTRTRRGVTETEAVLRGIVAFLIAQWERVAAIHPAADEFAADVARLHGQARAVLGDAPERRRRAYRPPCPNGCEQRALFLDTDRGEDTCPECARTWTLDEVAALAMGDGRPILLDAEDAAHYLMTTPRGLAVKVRAGQVRRVGGRYDISRALRRVAGDDTASAS